MLLADKLRWVLVNLGLEIKESQDLETHLNCNRDLTGSFNKISAGSVGNDKIESWRE